MTSAPHTQHTGSRPAEEGAAGSDRCPAGDRPEERCAAGRAHTPEQPRPAADPAGYATMFLRFITMKQAFPRLNHSGHEPRPSAFGLTNREAAFEREKILRDLKRPL